MVRGSPANERVRLAIFGNLYNSENIQGALHVFNAQVVALCNPDRRKISVVLKRWEDLAQKMKADTAEQKRIAEQYRRLANQEGLKTYKDIRVMLGEMAGQIDGLVVSDYDHLHGVACGAAMRAGKAVFSERPLGLNIGDARALRALAAQTKVPTTYRSPGTGNGSFRRAMELVEEGAIGPVKEVHVWFKRGEPDRDKLPQGKEVVPDGLDWDLWLGPLAWRDYHSDWMSYSHWRETCNGGLGVFGMHTSIFPFMTLGLRELWNTPGALIRVNAECSRVNRISFPRWERIRWDIPARKQMSPVTITWHHGPDFAPGARELIREKLRAVAVANTTEADALIGESAGSMLIGSEGAMVADDHSVRVTCLPKEKFAKVETKRPLRIPDSQGIYKDWVDACRGAKPHIIASFDNGGPLSELIMLGNIATLYPGQSLSYDPIAGRITNFDSANQHLACKYRDGWQL